MPLIFAFSPVVAKTEELLYVLSVMIILVFFVHLTSLFRRFLDDVIVDRMMHSNFGSSYILFIFGE